MPAMAVGKKVNLWERLQPRRLNPAIQLSSQLKPLPQYLNNKPWSGRQVNRGHGPLAIDTHRTLLDHAHGFSHSAGYIVIQMSYTVATVRKDPIAIMDAWKIIPALLNDAR